MDYNKQMTGFWDKIIKYEDRSRQCITLYHYFMVENYGNKSGYVFNADLRHLLGLLKKLRISRKVLFREIEYMLKNGFIYGFEYQRGKPSTISFSLRKLY